MADIKGLITITSGYLQDVDLEPLTRAYDYILEIHGPDKHLSGQPYVEHLLEVATTLASMKLDLDTIIAGLLHGSIKEGKATAEKLAKLFGEDVARLVDGTTRITNIQYNSQLAHQAENIRKFFLALSTDIRVLLVKLADRLQDMMTLAPAPEDIRRHVARETMDLYAPLASRLGIDWVKRELEDLSFQYLFPAEYENLVSRLEGSMDEREAYVTEVTGIIQAKLRRNNIVPVRILGRPKHLYSIYKKLVAQGITLERVYDKVAFRIILHTVKECYEALGIVHEDWQPVPGRIKDFISTPKSNNYQSLHTTVLGPHENFIEIQIRTEKMDHIAQEGVAAHWAYKEGQKISGDDARLFKELKQMVLTLQEVEDPREFLESVRGELYEPDVYALTPTGEVRELPRGSTPIDFAYSIHTAVGDRCSGAKVNGRMVPLKYELQNGDIVEIVTGKNQHPKQAWLKLVKTSRARTRIRAWLRREEKEKALAVGREICEKELKKYDTTLKKLIKTGHIRTLLKELRCNSLDDMLVKVGSGSITVNHLFKALLPDEYRDREEERQLDEAAERATRRSENKKTGTSNEAILIDGVDDMMARISQCCKPVPGDEIVGFITTGRGLSVHKADCHNLLATDPRRWLTVNWSAGENKGHRTEFLIRAESRKNIVADVSSTISSANVDIIEMTARTASNNLAEINVILEVIDLGHLQSVQQLLHQMPEVIEVHRK